MQSTRCRNRLEPLGQTDIDQGRGRRLIKVDGGYMCALHTVRCSEACYHSAYPRKIVVASFCYCTHGPCFGYMLCSASSHCTLIIERHRAAEKSPIMSMMTTSAFTHTRGPQYIPSLGPKFAQAFGCIPGAAGRYQSTLLQRGKENAADIIRDRRPRLIPRKSYPGRILFACPGTRTLPTTLL